MPPGLAGPIPSATFDWPTLIANKDKEIARLEAAYTSNVEKAGAQDRQDRARCSRMPHTLRLATGEKVRAKYMLIATGGAPNHGAADSRHRARDLLERGVSSARSCRSAS